MLAVRGWRPALFDVVQMLSRAVDGVARTLVYGAAGLLTNEQLSALIARRWSEFGADRAYILSPGCTRGRRTSTIDF